MSFQTNRYSVPFRFVGQPVEGMREGEHVMLYPRGELIATHPRCEGRPRCITDRTPYQGIYRREPLEIAAWRHPHPGFDTQVQVRDLGVYESLVEGGAR